MRNVVGATVAATSVSFVSAGKPTLFQATNATKFCSDPSFVSMDEQGNKFSFTKPNTPDAGSVNNPSGYFMVPMDKSMQYLSNPANHDGAKSIFPGFGFVDVPPEMCNNKKIFMDRRCDLKNTPEDENACKEGVPTEDQCGVVDDNKANLWETYVTSLGQKHWDNVDQFNCCPYDQVFGQNLSIYFAKFLQNPAYKGNKFGNCQDGAYQDFLNAFTDGPYSNVIKKCAFVYKAFLKGADAVCDIKPASLFPAMSL